MQLHHHKLNIYTVRLSKESQLNGAGLMNTHILSKD